MPVTGQKVIAKNLIAYGGQFTRFSTKTMKQAVKILDKKVTENISLTDHSIKSFRGLGHPYAKKHGPQGLVIHNPYYQVHKQSGDLLKSKYTKVSGGVTGGAFGTLELTGEVGLDPNIAPEANFVIFGTPKMIPRPVMQGSLNQTSDKIQDLFEKNLKNLTVTFK